MIFIVILIMGSYHINLFLLPTIVIDIIIAVITMVIVISIMSKGGERIWVKHKFKNELRMLQ